MAGLIFGILAFFCCCKFLFGLLGMIFSLVGLSQINRHPELYEGRGLAIAGLVLSILSLLLAVMLIMIALATGNFHFNWNFQSFLNRMPRAESQSIPPKISDVRRRWHSLPVGRAGRGDLGAGAVLYFFNPSTHGFYPVCLFHQLTGLELSGLRRDARRLRSCCTGMFARRCRTTRCSCCRSRRWRARRVVRGAKNSAPTGRADFCRRNFCGRCSSSPWFSPCCGICRRFHFSRRSAGVPHASLALFRRWNRRDACAPELFAFAGAPGSCSIPA